MEGFEELPGGNEAGARSFDAGKEQDAMVPWSRRKRGWEGFDVALPEVAGIVASAGGGGGFQGLLFGVCGFGCFVDEVGHFLGAGVCGVCGFGGF